MKKIGQHILLWLVSLSIVNTSIDVADESFSYTVAAPSSTVPRFNEIESIAEYVLDNTMNQTLPDHKGSKQNGMIKKACAFDFSMPEKKDKIILNIAEHITKMDLVAHYTFHLSPGYKTILTPPPNITTV